MWDRLKGPLITIGEKPLDDSQARAAYDIAKLQIDKANAASRALTVAIVIQVENQRFRTLTVLGGIGLFSGILFVLGLVFARRYISKPIEAMHLATDRVLHGDFSHRVPIVSNDEIAVLAKRFNAMLDEVNRSWYSDIGSYLKTPMTLSISQASMGSSHQSTERQSPSAATAVRNSFESASTTSWPIIPHCVTNR